MNTKSKVEIDIRKIRHEISIGISTIETARSGLCERIGNPESALDLHAIGVQKIFDVLEYIDALQEEGEL